MPGWEVIDKKESNALQKLFKEGGVLFAHGFNKFRKKYHVREFEKLSARKFNMKFAQAVSSGTAAIKIALLSLGVKRGDEVITQAFNFIATIEAILDIGAKPIIVDVDKTLNMCPKSLKRSTEIIFIWITQTIKKAKTISSSISVKPLISSISAFFI